MDSHGSVGNAAANRLQLDIYGEALYALSEGSRIVPSTELHGWKLTAKTLDWLSQLVGQAQ